MSKYEAVVPGDFPSLIRQLDDAILNSGISMSLVDENEYEANGVYVSVRVYDKYYIRSSNRTSLSLTVVNHDGWNYVSAIGSGGGTGALLRFDWGAEENIIKPVVHCIEEWKQ